METQQWPAKFQQSGAGTDTTQDSLNNGEIDKAAKEETGEGAPDNDNPQENDTPTIRSVKTPQIAWV